MIGDPICLSCGITCFDHCLGSHRIGITVEIDGIALSVQSGTETDTAAVGMLHLPGKDLQISRADLRHIAISQRLKLRRTDTDSDGTCQNLFGSIGNGQLIIVTAKDILLRGTVINDIYL